jgi:sister-chromatid-cohesion protein PDS5
LIDRISDGSEQVRAAICKVIGKLDYETALNYIQESTLRDIGYRLNDKKVRAKTPRETSVDARLWCAMKRPTRCASFGQQRIPRCS